MKRIAATSIGICLAVAGCAGIGPVVDRTPSGEEAAFPGLRQYLEESGGQLHVLQTHGMGNNPVSEFCSDAGENIRLQEALTQRLGLRHRSAVGQPAITPLWVGNTRVGAYSTRMYVDDVGSPTKALYFTCLSWGDASFTIKRHLLGLDRHLREEDERYRQRALVNRIGKDFVNQRFSDPMIYVGPFGSVIRKAVWQGIVGSEASHAASRAAFKSLAHYDASKSRKSFLSDVPTVVISDSLGSRVLFDVLTLEDSPSRAQASSRPAVTSTERSDVLRRIRGIFMLANQLPLLALAHVPPPPDDVPLEKWLATASCPLPDRVALGTEAPTTIVAMTDVNDLLSYHLSSDFKRRCSSDSVDIVNVTLTNARPLLGLFADPVKAHAEGFKTNDVALNYIVEGNRQNGGR